MKLYFNKLYKNNRTIDSYIGIPYAKGSKSDKDISVVYQNGKPVPTQERITARYEDGSVKYSFVRFQCELPANKGCELELKQECCDDTSISCLKNSENEKVSTLSGAYESNVRLAGEGGFHIISNKYLTVTLRDNCDSLIYEVKKGDKRYDNGNLKGPMLKLDGGDYTNIHVNEWKVCEEGCVLTRLKANGEFVGTCFKFECNISLSIDSESVEVSFRIINASDDKHQVSSLFYAVEDISKEDQYTKLDYSNYKNNVNKDSTGCGDLNGTEDDSLRIKTTGISKLSTIEEELAETGIRSMVGKSNYKTNFTIGKNGTPVQYLVDADYLIGEANEHFAEVFYGTFFADRTTESGGVAGTIFQAQQNFPKAVRADENGIYLMLVPEGSEPVIMNGGMSREQRFSLLFHDKDMKIEDIDDLSLRYQMPDRPYISPEVFKESGVMPDIFTCPDNWSEDIEIALVARADDHARAYGMLNFGDAPDMNYTTQGRGNGQLVWSNNEYDYPHACAMQYARTGERRFLDYCIASVRHWMDVDVCHYSTNPLNIGGQWEHTARHNENGVMVCSHEWVEGLLDYYHLTGDERGLETALGIGDNVLRLLDTPMYQTPGEANARETGWALRTLTALYVETSDAKWNEKSEWIINQFKIWKDTYGEWIAPYTDNTLIRTGFMISVAIGSLMRYYRVFPSEELKDLILGAVDDLIENATLPYGLFYYKELPSLNRLGNNTLLLEALTIGYELTGNKEYLKPGLKTFERETSSAVAKPGGAKKHIEDAVIVGSTSPKSFAQFFIPVTTYYVALLKENML